MEDIGYRKWRCLMGRLDMYKRAYLVAFMNPLEFCRRYITVIDPSRTRLPNLLSLSVCHSITAAT